MLKLGHSHLFQTLAQTKNFADRQIFCNFDDYYIYEMKTPTSFSLEMAVRDYELDSEGIVNNAIYLHYFEHTRHAFCLAAGYSFDQMKADGIIPVAAHIEIDYKTPLRSGDVMVSTLTVTRQGVKFVFDQNIYNKATGALATHALVNIVCIENGKLSRGDRLAKVFEKYLD